MARVLFVPSWQFSPRVCDILPAMHAALDDVRSEHQVAIFSWASVKGGRKRPPTWEAAVDDLCEAIEPGTHVLTPGSTAAVAMMAVGRRPAASFVTGGMLAPPATLRALGLVDLAAAVEVVGLASHSPQGGYQTMQTFMAGASEEEIRHFTREVDDDIDWRVAAKIGRSFNDLSLVHEGPLITAPTLSLEPAVQMAGWAEMQSVFLHFVPEAEVGELRLWPGKLHEPAAGHEFAAKALAFIAKAAA
ncbi:MAG: hypothetical protein WEB00_03945 [Dehalococcoidia bacterium]